MLVHLPTGGILEEIWMGKYGKENKDKKFKNKLSSIEFPIYTKATFKNTYLENPEEWREIPSSSSLAKKIMKYYPWIECVCDEIGNLCDVKILKLDERSKERERIKAEKQEDARKRGYRNRTNIRPKNLMPYLKLD